MTRSPGAPRQDRRPHIQLDAEVDKRSVTVSEGDVWQAQGGNRSGKFGEWQLTEITAARVTQELLEIIHRALRVRGGERLGRRTGWDWPSATMIRVVHRNGT